MDHISVIDLSPLFHDESIKSIKEVANVVDDAYKNVGFAYLVNHNVPKNVVKNAFNMAKTFHTLSLTEKMKIKQNDCFRGYVPINASTLKVSTLGKAKRPNQLDAFVMAFEPNKQSQDYKEGLYLSGDNQWPALLPELKKVLFDYRDHMLALSRKLIRVFSVVLGMEPHFLDPFFNNPTYFLRLQHYPKQKDNIPDDLFGLAPHTDYGFFTILAQESTAGLEVLTPDDRWIQVPCLENAFVLNTADMFKRWSNDSYKSTPYRVINKANKERFSIPFFFDPNMHAIIDVLPSRISKASPKKYPPIMHGDYLMQRIQGNYGLGKTRHQSATF